MKTKLQEIFSGDKRIVGLAGITNSGKTNNLISVLKEFREINDKVPIFAYGMPDKVMKYLKTMGVKEINSLKQMTEKKNCILVIDEFQRLRLNDARYRYELNDFVDFVHHRNVYVILSSPNIRSFNSVIGGVIDRWILKTVRADQCINGSQLKGIVNDYKGRHKSMGCIILPKDKILVINDEEETVIDCPYIEQADNKADNEDLLENYQEKISEEKQK